MVRAIKELIVYTVMVMIGILTFGMLKEMLSGKETKNPASVWSPPAPKIIETKEVKKQQPPSPLQRDLDPFQSRLERFQELKEKVLPTEKELSEKRGLLSDFRLLNSAEERLKAPKVELTSRLALIDYLEEAVIWSDNPIRDRAVSAIESLIQSESVAALSKEDKRAFVGDKIELFGILHQEFPDKAESLLKSAEGTPLEAILNYAKKRLALGKEMTR